MQVKTGKRARKWIIIAAAIYFGCGIILYFVQEQLLFHPRDHVFRFGQPFREINLPVNYETNLNIIRFTVPDSLRRGAVLYFHGNRENVERYAKFAVNFTRHNYEVWMMDYPGFGKSNGGRDEQILYNDAEIVYEMARSSVSRDSIIIYGKSIGTGIAAQLASVRDCKRLILETPYYSIDALFSHYAFIYPVSWMAKYHFPTYRYFEQIAAPVTIFHGTRDGTIPYSQGKRLAGLTKNGGELVTIEGGGHNNLNDFPLFHQKLDSVLRLP